MFVAQFIFLALHYKSNVAVAFFKIINHNKTQTFQLFVWKQTNKHYLNNLLSDLSGLVDIQGVFRVPDN